MGLLKNRSLQVKVVKNDGKDTEVVTEVEPAEIAQLVQDTSRVIVSQVIVGVGAYVLLDTFRKVVVKMVPGH